MELFLGFVVNVTEIVDFSFKIDGVGNMWTFACF